MVIKQKQQGSVIALVVGFHIITHVFCLVILLLPKYYHSLPYLLIIIPAITLLLPSCKFKCYQIPISFTINHFDLLCQK